MNRKWFATCTSKCRGCNDIRSRIFWSRPLFPHCPIVFFWLIFCRINLSTYSNSKFWDKGMSFIRLFLFVKGSGFSQNNISRKRSLAHNICYNIHNIRIQLDTKQHAELDRGWHFLKLRHSLSDSISFFYFIRVKHVAVFVTPYSSQLLRYLWTKNYKQYKSSSI